MCHTAFPLCPISPTYHKVSIAMSHWCGSKPLISGPSSSWDAHRVSSQTSYGYPKSWRSYSYWWWWGSGVSSFATMSRKGQNQLSWGPWGTELIHQDPQNSTRPVPMTPCGDAHGHQPRSWLVLGHRPRRVPWQQPRLRCETMVLGESTSHSDQAKHYSWWGPMFRYKRRY